MRPKSKSRENKELIRSRKRALKRSRYRIQHEAVDEEKYEGEDIERVQKENQGTVGEADQQNGRNYETAVIDEDGGGNFSH